ncbi:Acyl-CoA dehydrogenase [Amycolatopsis marina]|uniref:Acyl-CoA dehydrogenase n=1 Tax=Amycolatopsis marina TaxID=490629 RepID=A0A1I1AJD8_9PSEU|nr:acyl-CoA dehydrogenase family protein [Amycolatopsis marina]SFB38037.1 Acyl-CoA dehydrogenase [Amycolatopsis marina]
MDFAFTEAQRDLAGLTRKIASAVPVGQQKDRHGSGGFDQTLWTDLARAGILDAALPAAVGGGGFGLLEQCSVLVELGRAVAPVPFAQTVTAAAAALAEFGTSEQWESWLVPVTRGERTLAVALPDTGVPPGFETRRTAGGLLLSGAHTAVAFAAFADGILIPARTEDGDAVFLVERERAGVSVRAQQVVDRADAALVELTDVAVGEADRLGTGMDVAEWLRLHATVGLVAQQLGVLERALELTAEYARERKQFDQVIGAFQAVRQRLADAYTDVEAVRLTLWQAAWCLTQGSGGAEEVATAKFWAAEAGHRVAHTAVHIHGGVGIDIDHPLHRYFAAAKRGEFALGGATAQLRSLGALLAAAATT